MSNDVYGFVATSNPAKTQACLSAAAAKRGIGLTFVTEKELFNFPAEFLPTGSYVAFALGDRPGKTSADYLTDMIDYAPGALDDLHASGVARLNVLIDWIDEIAGDPSTELLCIAVAECSEIESHAHVKRTELRELMLRDFRSYAPPNKLYLILGR